MKSKFLFGSVALLSVGAIAWAAKDPVVMTINGEDVPKSELEYLYHKNSQQQIEAQPLEEYLGMFELYKMKVADAKAEGIDTTAAFISEMAQYRRDLANPYLADSVYLNKLIDEAYQNSREELDYSHIMLSKGRTAAENMRSRALADSIQQALVAGADFEELARKYSTDRTVTTNGGHLGYIASGSLPYRFEHAAYALKPGQISNVVESNAGYHILKGGPRRPAKGTVKASHILKKIAPDATPEEEARIKQQVDSLYLYLSQNPDQFEAVALKESEDPGSARMGGMIGWFSSGMMVPEFSEKAFEINVGEVGEPVRTMFGWHIIKKLDAHAPQSRAEMKPQLLSKMNDPRDERFNMIRDNRDNKLAKKHKAKVNDAAYQAMKQHVAQKGVSKEFYSTFGDSQDVLFTVEGKPYRVCEFVETFSNANYPDAYIGGALFDEKYAAAYDEALVEAEEDWLYANVSDYRNLLNEYRDGSLLFEVSNQKVWNKAANDNQGLENYFQQHRSDYTFSEPRGKGFLVLAKNDSIAHLIRARFPELDKDSVVTTLRNEFRNEAVIDRFLVTEGYNRFADKVLFNGPDPELNPKFPVYFILDGRVIEQPEEMSDVKGQVTSDYQQLLDQNWTTELRKRYPVVRYEKELKKIK